MPHLVDSLSPYGGKEVSMAILTTDTRPKVAKVCLKIRGRKVTLGGMAKGAGMISPRMATLISIVTTDCNISSHLLKSALKEKVEDSFNQINVDGDTSTNDSLFILANALGGNPIISKRGKDYSLFASALGELLDVLSYKILEDAEGATKVIDVEVRGGRTLDEAKALSRAVVESNLVKAMVYGSDPNFGRVLAAIGKCGRLCERKINIWIQGIKVFSRGRKAYFDSKILSRKMAHKRVSFLIELSLGKFHAKALGCDLTPGYVRINADYKT
jgi:glutamate N-acetyltransferase/amino-acid N-acetyltransferase